VCVVAEYKQQREEILLVTSFEAADASSDGIGKVQYEGGVLGTHSLYCLPHDVGWFPL
jgi:hypothetical protein